MDRKVRDELIKLANKYSKIVCGFPVGKREENKIIVKESYVQPARSGPKIHFRPNWSAYRSTKNWIHERKKRLSVNFISTLMEKKI